VQTMFVVVINDFADGRFELTAMEYQHRVEAGRRMVPTNRSVNAFARGDRMGALMVRTPSARNTSSKQRRVHVEEVTRQHRQRLGSQELRPCRPRASRRWVDTVAPQDRAHTGGCESHAHGGKFTVDYPRAQGGVLPCQPQHPLGRPRGQSCPAVRDLM
jgi:hypothetical protein